MNYGRLLNQFRGMITPSHLLTHCGRRSGAACNASSNKVLACLGIALIVSIMWVNGGHAASQSPTTASLTSSPNPATYSQSVAFTATVSASSGTPTGKVTFFNGSASLGSATLSGGIAALTKTTLHVGINSITAVYAGNAAFSASTSPVLSQEIDQATSSVALTSSLDPAIYGQSVTLTATVSASSGTPTGKVTFLNGSATLGTATLSGGIANFTTTTLPVGTASITAVYNGGNNFSGSASSVLSQEIDQTTTSVSVSSSLNPATYGQPVTLAATVSASSGTPTGKVTFLNGSATLGTATLSGGIANFTTTTLPVGTASITAVYNGGNNFSGSASSVLSQEIDQATTSVSLSSSLNPAAYGQPVTLAATVSASSGTPTGKVTFLNGSATLGTATLAGGNATITKSNLSVGIDSITAVYAGNNAFAGSTSPVLSQEIDQIISSVSLSSSPNPASYGQSVTFTSMVSSPAGPLTGKVTFMNGSATLGSAILSGGIGTLSTQSLPSGTLTITSSYPGSTNYSAGSASLIQTINPSSSMGYSLGATMLNPNWFTPGSTSTSTITVTPVSGYTGSVSLSCSVTGDGSPAPSCSFNPSSVTINGAAAGVSTLTVSTSTSTAISNYMISVSGTDTNSLGPGNGSQTLILNAVAAGSPSYILSATALTPSSVGAGSNAASTITVYPANGYTGSVGLSCDTVSGGSAAPFCSFNPSSVTLDGVDAATATLTVSTSTSTPANIYSIPVDASDANGLTPLDGPQTLTLSTQSAIQHVVVIFQENRTPDNLFQDPVLIAAGADIAQSGINSLGQVVPLSPIDLGTAGANPQYYDLNHDNKSFLAMYDAGRMDGADRISCNPFSAPSCPPNAQFMYVNPADVQPYFALAEQYTFGDRMFETSQAGSYPAHQFIISGTSAPAVGSPLFAAGGPTGNNAGCIASPGVVVPLIDPNGNPAGSIYPCFEHPVLSDLLDAQGLSWHYYYSVSPASIWTGPNSIEHMCQEQEIGDVLSCEAPEWLSNVVNPATRIFTDITNGQLPQVSWVIPPGAYSDHPHGNNGGGPSWVASIVNAIGNSPYWSNTVIILTWDDWGGWYDHVAPKIINDGVSWGSGFVYGFRVPLVVVSPYAKAGYISHVTHDFGSIVKFIESNFNLPSLGYADAYADDLSDCFDLTQAPIQFQSITTTLDAAHFLNDKTPVTPPDDD